jgi:hypothetical protein
MVWEVREREQFTTVIRAFLEAPKAVHAAVSSEQDSAPVRFGAETTEFQMGWLQSGLRIVYWIFCFAFGEASMLASSILAYLINVCILGSFTSYLR